MKEKKKILLVEDEALIAMAQAQTIEGFGYEVITAYSGERAVEAVRHDLEIDLICMDIDLGSGIDGTEAARKVLAFRDIPIIFLTSHGERETVERVRSITRYGYVIKNSGDFVLKSSIEMGFELFSAHQALQHAESRVRTTLQSIGDAVISTDIEGRIDGMNAAAESATGWKETEALGRPLKQVFTIVDAKTRRPAEDPVEKVLRVKKTVGLSNHTTLITRDGREIVIADSGAPIRNDYGEITGVVLVFHDQTAEYLRRRMIEIRLFLYEYSSDHSLEDTLIELLDRMESLTGSEISFFHFIDETRGSILLQSWSTRTTEYFCSVGKESRHLRMEDAGVWIDCVRQRKPVIHNDYSTLPHRSGLPPGHAPITRELLVPVLRGNTVVAIMGLGNKSREYDEDDVEAASFLADVAWSIAQRKKDRDQMAFQARVLDQIQERITVTDIEGNIIYVNQAESRMFGVSREKLVGKNVYSYGDNPAEGATQQEIVETTLAEGEWRGRIVNYRQDGTPLNLDARTYVVKNDLGETIALCGISTEIEGKREEE